MSDHDHIERQGRSLRRTVNAVALSIACLIGVGVPAGYAVVGYGFESSRAAFRVQLGAHRLSRFIYENAVMWQYQTVRLAEVVELPEASMEGAREWIFDQDGNQIFSGGTQASRFELSRVAPVVVAGATVGSFQFSVPLDPLLRRLGIVSLLSILLSLGSYFAVRVLPLRALDRALRELSAANAVISRKNADLLDQNQSLEAREVELRRAEATLTQRSGQLVEAQRMGKIGDWSYRLGDDDIWWSPELYSLLEYDPVSFRTSHAAVVGGYIDDGAQRVLEAQAEVARTGAIKSVDIKYRRGDNSIGDLVVTNKATSDADGHIIGFHGTIQDISERKRAEEQLEQLAYHDPLTALANRALFHRELNSLLVRQLVGKSGALLLLDLDRFKEVNDSLGHAAGDELLVRVAHLLSRQLGSRHVLSRLGGDEFAIIVRSYTALAEVETLAAQVISAIADPISLSSGEVLVGASIGIALFPHDGNNVGDLLRHADLALYQAKEEGRGRAKFFNPDMSEIVQHKIALARDLRGAVQQNCGLAVHYQPQADLSSGRVVGFEALLRWNHPVRGNVPPAEFIPIAESSQLICDLGLWVLRAATNQAKRWIDAGEPPREVAVNVYAAQIWHSDFIGDVVRVLNETRLPPHLLCLELTESLMADHAVGRVRKVLTELKKLGVTLALDDFGTDYSSLGYLTQLPFDKLKIDRIFIDGIAESARARKLLEGIVALGRGLGMTIVAEGAEKVAEVEILRSFRCDMVQGYVYARPMIGSEAIAFARSKDHDADAGLMTVQAAVA
ncbi:EAL domain-containing protein [Tardiphaga sp. vice304]|uniref:putative bifunctional diguanylate cyclase/phosphodiesterase n=1 Tax=Tardiphaga sp. vice304 TaxID=2592817 RepID=UPI0011636157|nr:bifunctional diguanylate cyclase/phosphodiesterase [Tardiphaga sp. vice304]QDM28815.1 EAL domain-containing protein [Tardiphaga sp. vice304]